MRLQAYAGPSVHGKHNTRDESRGWGAQIDRCPRNIFRIPKAPHRCSLEYPRSAFRVGIKCLVRHRGVNPTRSNRVYANTLWGKARKLNCEQAPKTLILRQRRRRPWAYADKRCHGGHEQDAASPPGQHLRHDSSGQAGRGQDMSIEDREEFPGSRFREGFFEKNPGVID